MKNLILYGAPASGKGTLCELLVKNYGYKHISTGQLFRDLSDDIEFNLNIKKKIAEGILIDDETTCQILKNKLNEIDGSIVLDGFPRNLNQAKMLESFFNNYIVINLKIDEDIALKRAIGRLNCPNCDKIYNKYFLEASPNVPGICDKCGVKLVSRVDDNADSFKKRFDIYLENVSDVLKYYKDKSLLYIVDSSRNKDEVFESIKGIIEGE